MTDDCACTDGEPLDYSRTWTVKAARKEHRCEECREPIKVGESYQRTEGFWEGDHVAITTCLSCIQTRNEIIEKTGEIPCVGSVGGCYAAMLRGELPMLKSRS